MIKNIILFITVFLIAAEIAAYATFLMLPKFREYNDLDKYECSACKEERFHPILGWNTFGEPADGDGIRESGLNFTESCVATFGDSFTYGVDVDAKDSFSGQLAQILGCDIKNYGVGGYSYIQAYKKLHLYKPEEPIVVFVIYEEMIKRALSASTLFYSGKNKFSPRPYATMSMGKLKIHDLPGRLTAKDFKAFHNNDFFSLDSIARFPYTVYVPKAMMSSHRITRTWNFKDAWDNEIFSRPLDLFLQKLALDFSERGVFAKQQLALVFIPDSRQIENYKSIDQFIEESTYFSNDEKCVVLPGLELSHVSKEKNILSKTTHFNVFGNRVIAESIRDTLHRCGISF